MGITVAGTASDCHRIPFYAGTEWTGITKSGAKVVFYLIAYAYLGDKKVYKR